MLKRGQADHTFQAKTAGWKTLTTWSSLFRLIPRACVLQGTHHVSVVRRSPVSGHTNPPPLALRLCKIPTRLADGVV